VLDFSVGGLALPGISPGNRSRDKTNPAPSGHARRRLAELLGNVM
jgi:hypothetical protein